MFPAALGLCGDHNYVSIADELPLDIGSQVKKILVNSFGIITPWVIALNLVREGRGFQLIKTFPIECVADKIGGFKFIEVNQTKMMDADYGKFFSEKTADCTNANDEDRTPDTRMADVDILFRDAVLGHR
jgi:hypothetical protein